MLIASIALVVVVATALAWWCGWGFARLMLPTTLLPFRRLLAPLVGYAMMVVAGYWSVRTVVGLNSALPVLLIFCTMVNILAWRRTGSPWSCRLPVQMTRSEGVALFLLILATIGVGVFPLIHYNQPAAIGDGWDIEVALPIVRYLERVPVAAIATMPDNPLRDLVAHPPRISHNIGFAVWQGYVDLLGGFEAFVSFTPLIAWLRGLGILAIYALLRIWLGLPAWTALAGAGLASLNALLLWVSYFNFEKQLAGFPLIPLALVIGAAAVEEIARYRLAAWRSAFLAAVVLSALPVTYYPAITVWAALAAGMGVVRLIEVLRKPAEAPSPWMLIRAAAALLVLTLMFAAPTVEDYLNGFGFRYSHQVTSLGIFDYIPVSVIVGLEPFLLSRSGSVAPDSVVYAGGLALGLLVAGALAFGPLRLRLAGLLIGGIVYLAWLRWWQAYPYGYMKGAAYVGFVFSALAAAGIQGLRRWIAERWNNNIIQRVGAHTALIVIATGLCALMGVNQAQVVVAHLDQPGLYPDDAPTLLALRQIIPPGSTVTLTSDQRVRGVINGFAAYALDHTVVWGHVRTGYTRSQTGDIDAIGEYGLLYAFEDPLLWGYTQPPIWRGGSYALYRRPPEVQRHLRVLKPLVPGETLTLRMNVEQWESSSVPGSAFRSLRLMVASLAPAAIEINGIPIAIPPGRHTMTLAVPPFQEVRIRHVDGALPLIETITLLADPDPNTIQAMRVVHSTQPTGGLLMREVTGIALVQASAVASDTHILMTLAALLPDAGPLNVALDIWDVERGVQYGWYGLLVMPEPEVQRFSLFLSLADGQMRGVSAQGGDVPLGAYFAGLQPGRYTARLYLAASAQVVSEPIDLFGFDITSDRAMTNVWTRDHQMQAIRAIHPMTFINVRVADDVAMVGYTLLPARPKPGDTVDLIIWWRSLRDGLDERSVLVHLVDAAGTKRAQADGPPAAGTMPTGKWRAGLTIVDARRLTLPVDLPSGDYTLLVGMYRWPSLERLPLVQGNELLPEAVFRVPVAIGE